MAKAKKLPSGSWRVRLYTGKDENGKPVYKSFTAPGRREAAAALYAVQKKQKEEIGMTVGEAIDGYIAAKQHKIVELPTVAEIIHATKGTDIELPVLLALWLSLRLSEVRGLRYGDISGGVLTVRNIKVKFGAEEYVKERTKTWGSTRQLAIPTEIAALIGEGEPDAYIVTLAAQTITKKLKRYVERDCGKTVTFHQLRHLNASVMLQLGVPDKYAMERGGWASNNTLKAVYQHTFSEKRKEIDSQIDVYFRKLYDTKNDTGV